MITAILVFAAAAFALSPEGPGPFPPSTGGSGFERPSREAFYLTYESKAEALRDEMLALQQSDGGELTPQHRADLQERLEALLIAYRRDVTRADPMSVNADGSIPR